MKNRWSTIAAMLVLAPIFFVACNSSNGGGTNPAPAVVAPADTTPTQPYVTHRGVGPWAHWAPPEQPRPVYNWHSERVREVTCSARDSHGVRFLVIERDYKGLEFRDVIVRIEDSAVDRCYANTHGDVGCRFEECRPGY